MPTYEYRCDACGNAEDAYRTVDTRDDAPLCCGRPMARQISRVMGFVQADICYDSPVTGKAITSKQARIEDLARHNCRPYDPEMKTDYQRRIADDEKKLDKAVDETIDRTIAAMPARKREKLEAELQGGVTAEPVRLTAPVQPIRTDIQHGSA
jgi:putative FmdB family regulatory protein